MQNKNVIDTQGIVENEIQKVITRQFSQKEIQFGVDRECYRHFVENDIVRVTLPEEPPVFIGLLTTSSQNGFTQAQSIKPGNIRIHLKKLALFIPAVVDFADSISSQNLLRTIGSGLAIVASFCEMLVVKVDDIHVLVFAALWDSCGSDNSLSLEDGFAATNDFLKRNKKAPMSHGEYNKAINMLNNIHCLDVVDGKLLLKEKISKKFFDPSKLFLKL